MGFDSFLYRQRQRLISRLSKSQKIKQIAEINLFKERITICRKGFWIKELGFLLPKDGFDFVFDQRAFDLLHEIVTVLGGEYECDENSLYFKFDDLKIQITSKSELFIIHELFVNKCYQFNLPFGEPVHVVDIGMNVGIAALFFAGLSNVKKIYACEPFVPTFDQAKRNLEMNPVRAKKIEAFNFGLGDRHEELTADYDVANKGINTSLVRNARKGFTRKEKIIIHPATDFLDRLTSGNPGVSFVLKVDTEGAEYRILESLFKEEVSAQVRGIMVEWHFHGPQKLEEMFLSGGFAIMSFRLNRHSGLIYAFR